MSLAMDCLERLPVHAAGLATCQCQILRFGNGALAIDWVKDKVTKAHAVLLRERGGSGTRLAAELTVCGLSAGGEWIRTSGPSACWGESCATTGHIAAFAPPVRRQGVTPGS